MKDRAKRLESVLREELASILSTEIKDPRIGGLVSITGVKASPDLRRAKVYVSVLGNAEEQAATAASLKAATGFIRRLVGERVPLRFVPELEFALDTSLAEADHIDALIRQLHAGTESRQDAPAKSEMNVGEPPVGTDTLPDRERVKPNGD